MLDKIKKKKYGGRRLSYAAATFCYSAIFVDRLEYSERVF